VSIFYLTPGCPIAQEFPEMTESDIFKARSTAMAIETDQFHRDDLYTLFITARIINFLKGLQFGRAQLTLPEAILQASQRGVREKLGLELLGRLLEEKRLYAATNGELKPPPGFKADLFFRVWKKARCVQTQKGVVIST
jgi:hypothetical protein